MKSYLIMSQQLYNQMYGSLQLSMCVETHSFHKSFTSQTVHPPDRLRSPRLNWNVCAKWFLVLVRYFDLCDSIQKTKIAKHMLNAYNRTVLYNDTKLSSQLD